MHSFLYRGSKDIDQNIVTGVIKAPCIDAARLFLKTREIEVHQLEVRPSTRTYDISEVPPARRERSSRKSCFSRSEVVWGGCWLFAFAFMFLFVQGKTSRANVAAANSPVGMVSVR
jgi:hypothetical protein